MGSRLSNLKSKFAILFIGVVVFSAASFGESKSAKDDYRRPLDIPFPEHAPYSPQTAVLGKMLFFDPRLSGSNNINCTTCHNPSFGFEVPQERPLGAANIPIKRHSPTVLNSAWGKSFFWDGRAKDLEEQAEGPITAPEEMNGDFHEISFYLSQSKEYNYWFKKLFPEEGISQKTILTALATYERTLVSGWAPFDRWVDGDETAITDAAKRGFELFIGKAKCANCHTGWNFTDNQFHDIGIPGDDLGRGSLEPNNLHAQHAFKTPSLRNLTHRAPYMHDGSVPTLMEVIFSYESPFERRESLSPKMEPITLSHEDRLDLIEFLESLTAETTEIQMPILPE